MDLIHANNIGQLGKSLMLYANAIKNNDKYANRPTDDPLNHVDWLHYNVLK
jgi:hypothetical protein